MNSKKFLSIFASVLFFQSFNSIHAMDSIAVKLALGAVAIVTAYSGVWEYVPLKLATWRFDVSKKKSKNIVGKEYHHWDDEKLIDTYKNDIELYNNFCSEVQHDKNTLFSIQQATDCDVEFWWKRKKADKFSAEIRLFSDASNKRLRIVTERLKFFEERKALVELVNLVSTEAEVMRENTKNRSSKMYPYTKLFDDLDKRIQKYTAKITAVEAFEKKSGCLEKYLTEAKENKKSLQETQNLINDAFSPLLKKK